MEWRNEKRHLHRTDGPAVEYTDGYLEWWINGKRHRVGGPAVIWEDGTQEWWIDGQQLTQFEHWVLTSTKATVYDID